MLILAVVTPFRDNLLTHGGIYFSAETTMRYVKFTLPILMLFLLLTNQ